MLKRLVLRDFVIVTTLELELAAGFSVLTGETGAGKSILVDAVQLALGSRADAGVVREGAQRADICAEFDTPPSLLPWLDAAGFEADTSLLLRRVIDAQGKSRAWINGSVATAAQLRAAADHLVDIHGQHAWQKLTQSASVRELLDAYAGIDTLALAQCWSAWKNADTACAQAQTQQSEIARERERLVWQIGELDKLAPQSDEWSSLNSEHQRLANAQALMDAAHSALGNISEHDNNASTLARRAGEALLRVAEFDSRLASVAEVVRSASDQLQDAAHSLGSYLHHTELDPQRLQALDARIASWMGLAKRYRSTPAELPELLTQWQAALEKLDAAADLKALEAQRSAAQAALQTEAQRVSKIRRQHAPQLSAAITQAMQQLGMVGGVFEVALLAQTSPQSFGAESAEFLVAGHAGSTPRPLAKVASGGELSRIALAIAVTTSSLTRGDPSASTLIFDEVDSGVGGAVADTVGRLMQQLGRSRQVLAVTHLPQVAACADQHFVVAKTTQNGAAESHISNIKGPARVSEIARMLGGAHLASTSLAHAQEMLVAAPPDAQIAPTRRPKMGKKTP
jgi:DNA repair protein RecN (Recombination protein N)